ncbi:MAG: isochorismatase family protein [Deltaproteobacteria bacterium]|nr:isochorismatase family protein [Deltaproteobacteria bacterium]
MRRLNRSSLIITGIEAHICVAQTALHAISDHTVHVTEVPRRIPLKKLKKCYYRNRLYVLQSIFGCNFVVM